MGNFAALVMSGMTSGMIYGSLALALVIIHRSTHLINFAQGEMAMLSTYLAWILIQSGAGYWTAFLSALVISFVAGGAIHWLLMRPLRNAPTLATTVIFIALLIIMNSLAGWIFTYSVKSFPSPFAEIHIFQGLISSHELGAIGVTFAMLIVLYVFFRFTRTGLRMRASAENPGSARLLGVRVDRMLALGWGLSAVVGAVAGMMVAPILFLDPNMMTGVLLYAFAAALLGGIDSPGGAIVGGILVGVGENILGAYAVGTEVQLTAALVVIIGILTLKPGGLFGRTATKRV